MVENESSDNAGIRVRDLPPTRVAFYRATSLHPEREAFEVLLAWAKSQGLLDSPYRYRIFGFDDPCPVKDGDVYTYEVWLPVEDGVKASGDIGIKDFDGGTYAVLQTDLVHIGENWRRMSRWLHSSNIQLGPHQCLEETLSPPETPEEELRLDLYMPICH